jgi:hypothetical protein
MNGQWLNEEFYVVVYLDGGEEKKEEFKTYTEAFEFYENLIVDSANGDYKVLQKVVEWENGEEYIDVLEEE